MGSIQGKKSERGRDREGESFSEQLQNSFFSSYFT